jgi:hypothetical protein
MCVRKEAVSLGLTLGCAPQYLSVWLLLRLGQFVRGSKTVERDRTQTGTEKVVINEGFRQGDAAV